MEEKINSGVTRTGETDIRLNLIDSFPNHPYHVFDDEDMTELTASIEANGLLNPIIERSKADGRYELISGHRRKRAYEILKIKIIRAIIVDVSDDEAIIMMVDSKSRITTINDLRELAIFAHHISVRKYAANLLPKDSLETRLLITAAEISERIEPYAIDRFENIVKQLDGHSSILETVAISYPFPGVRYLARKRAAIKPKATKNMEEMLRSKTPTSYEMQQRKEIDRCRELLSGARWEAREFSRGCNNQSEAGKTSYQMQISSYRLSLKSFEESDLFVKLLSNELNKIGFSEVFIKKEPDYITHYDNKTELIGFNIYVSTNW